MIKKSSGSKSTSKGPAMYSKTIDSPNFRTREEAESWAKSQKAIYKTGAISVKYTIKRTPQQGWKGTLYVKVS